MTLTWVPTIGDRFVVNATGETYQVSVLVMDDNRPVAVWADTPDRLEFALSQISQAPEWEKLADGQEPLHCECGAPRENDGCRCLACGSS